MNFKSPRMLIALGLVVAAVVAFFVVQPGSSDDSNTPTTAKPAATGASGATGPTTAQKPKPPKPQIQVIDVKGGEPVGGVQKIEVSQGDQIQFVVKSDTANQVHVHGFNKSAPVGPGQPARFSFEAGFTGVFEVELEETAVPIIELQVNP